MLTPRIRAALVVLAASAGLSACTSLGPYGGVGVGVGSGYGSYGYDPYYGGYGYGSPYGYGYGSGYGYDPFGWYNGYYYPGSGYWVYDQHRNKRALTDEEKAYWRARVQQRYGITLPSSSVAQKENWSGFNRPSGTAVSGGTAATTGATGTGGREAIRQRMVERQQAQQQARIERQQAQSERAQSRSERFEARQQSSEQREARRPRRGSTDN